MRKTVITALFIASLAIVGCVKKSEPVKPEISQSELADLDEMQVMYHTAKSPINRVAIGKIIEKRAEHYDAKSLPTGFKDFLKGLKAYRDTVKM
jgi:hypothetical protein